MRTLLCTGGRGYSDREAVAQVLRGELLAYPCLRVIVGDAKGCDALVREWCEGHINVIANVYWADWDTHGKAAGPMRNQAMIDAKPDVVYAFPGGRGTGDCIRRAKHAGIAVHEVGVAA